MNSNGQILISIFLISSLIILPMTLTAKERQGAELHIQRINGQKIKGELIALKENSLLLKEHNSGADVTAAVGEIKTITIVRKSKVWMGAGTGFGLGATGGALAGLLWEDTGDWTNAGLAFFFGICAGVIGALTGGIVGVSLGIDKTIEIERRPESEIKGILEDLRKKARVPNFQ